MSLPNQFQRDLEDLYNQLEQAVDTAEWSDARRLIAHAIDQDHVSLAKAMQGYYNDNRCEDCLGTGVIVEGDFDNQIEKKCVCQIEK